MNIASFDLNLLVAFEAIERERNITRAADRIGISQPAMSNALARLRRIFDDPLFVRTPNGMEPTPLAVELVKPIRTSCGLIADALKTAHAFDPATSARKFTFYLSDIGEVVNLPPILRHLQAVAPRVTVTVSRIPQHDVQEAMAAGDVDIALGFYPSLKGGFFEQLLYRDIFVCIARAGHPTIGRALTRKQFCELPHGVVRSPGTGHDAAVERAVAAQRISRRIAVAVPHFMALPMIIGQTDFIATVPLKAAQSFSHLTELKVMKPPVKIPGFEIKQHWHERFHHDPANRWMRIQVGKLFIAKGRKVS